MVQQTHIGGHVMLQAPGAESDACPACLGFTGPDTVQMVRRMISHELAGGDYTGFNKLLCT